MNLLPLLWASPFAQIPPPSFHCSVVHPYLFSYPCFVPRVCFSLSACFPLRPPRYVLFWCSPFFFFRLTGSFMLFWSTLLWFLSLSFDILRFSCLMFPFMLHLSFSLLILLQFSCISTPHTFVFPHWFLIFSVYILLFFSPHLLFHAPFSFLCCFLFPFFYLFIPLTLFLLLI